MTELARNIRCFRERAGLTQEGLAALLNISAQAVSKWERGESLPDALTLPAIADALGVSLDRLYGHESAGLDDAAYLLEKYMSPYSRGERLAKIHKIAYLCEKLAMGCHIVPSHDCEADAWFDETGSVCNETERAFSFASNRPELPFYAVFVEPEKGRRALFDADGFREFFEIMSQPRVLDTLLALYEKPSGIVFDESYAAREFGLDKPREVLDRLSRLGIIRCESVNIDGNDTRIYHFRARCGFIALLSVLDELLHHNRYFDLQSNTRRSPYLR